MSEQQKVILLEERRTSGRPDKENLSSELRANLFEEIMKKNRETQEKLKKDRQANNLTVLKNYKIK